MFFSTKPILGIQGFSQVLVVLVGSSQKTRRKFKIMLNAKGSAQISLQCRKLCEISHFFVSIREKENQKSKKSLRSSYLEFGKRAVPPQIQDEGGIAAHCLHTVVCISKDPGIGA